MDYHMGRSMGWSGLTYIDKGSEIRLGWWQVMGKTLEQFLCSSQLPS